jgi:hypothetical protein
MEELHTDSIDGGHEASYGARSRARERAYSNNLIRFINKAKLSPTLFLRLILSIKLRRSYYNYSEKINVSRGRLKNKIRKKIRRSG